MPNKKKNNSKTVEAIRQLMAQPDPPKKRIGFEVDEPKSRYGKK